MAEREEQTIKDYKDLHVWQKGMELATLVYLLTQKFPSEEKFGLVSQMRRAAVSIPSNIAEGQARNTTGEYVQFISHAEGSAAELDTQLRLVVNLGYGSDAEIQSTLMLVLLRRAIRRFFLLRLARGFFSFFPTNRFVLRLIDNDARERYLDCRRSS